MSMSENARADLQIVKSDMRSSSGAHKFKLCCELSAEPVAKRHLIKGIFARGETSAWAGPPGSLKSALLASAAIALASGTDWFGYRNKGPAGVVYFALERADLVERRIRAEIARRGLSEDLPIAIVQASFDLVRPDSVRRVLATIQDAAKCFNVPVGVGIFDTYAKLVAAANGDENLAKDVGPIFDNIEKIKNQLDIHAALIAHTGKDLDRGARGSSALPGHLDLLVTISGDQVKTATVTKVNDGPEGPLFSFQSEIHRFGFDEDGDPIEVNIVANEAAEAPPPSREPKLTANQKTLYGMLHAAGKGGLLLQDWNDQARDAGIGVKRKADLNDIRSALLSKGLISQYGERWSAVQS